MSPAFPSLVAERYESIQERCKSALAKRGNGRTATLIAVSKTHPTESIEALYRLGQRDFGENYAQELIQKGEELKESCPEIRWHFIGHLQSNKVKLILPWVHAIHSVDSLKLAQEISKRAVDRTTSVFIEVNIDGETSKAGVAPSECPELAKNIAALPQLRLEGLMCIPAAEQASTSSFSRLRELELTCRPFTLGQLSMGMSSDFEEAILQGSTYFRVGTALFGDRSQR